VYRPQFEISPQLLDWIAEISAVRELIQSAAILPQWDLQLRRQANLERAHHSTAIEGNPLSAQEVAGLQEGKEIPARERDKREVLNYLEALRLLDRWSGEGEAPGRDPGDQEDSPAYSLETIYRLHAALTAGLLPSGEQGALRREVVAVVDPGGRIVFQAPPPADVPALLRDLVAWLEGPSRSLHPVLAAGLAHYELVRIHPFSDGNGRTARLLATLILNLRGFDTRRFFALEEYYNRNLVAYYAALAGADRTGELGGWLEYFAEGVAVSLRRVREAIAHLSLDSRLKQAKGQVYLDERQMELLRRLGESRRLRIAEVQALFGVSRETANRILDPLLEHRLVVRRGLARATYYELAEVR
jgi:Fic family protein